MPAAEVKERLDHLLLALGPSNTYAYALRPPSCDGHAATTPPVAVPDGSCIHWAAFGPTAQSFYYCYQDLAEGSFHSSWGNDVPSKLRDWLSNTKRSRTGDRLTRQKNTRVVLGPGRSFIAWDHESIRWSDIPDFLEETLQSWFGPKGWKYGRLSHATLGCDGAFFVVTAKGASVWTIPPSLKSIHSLSIGWTKKGPLKCSLHRVCLSPCNPEQYIIVDDVRAIKANCPDKEGLISVADYLYGPEEREIRRQARQEASWRGEGTGSSFSNGGDQSNSYQQQQQQHSGANHGYFSRSFPAPDDYSNNNSGTDSPKPSFEGYENAGSGHYGSHRKRSREEESSSSSNNSNGYANADNATTTNADDGSQQQEKKKSRRDLLVAVEMWRAHCNDIFSGLKPVVFFPMLPTSSCRCERPGCKEVKTKSSLKACKHEVQDVLRACDGYSVEWLRKERLRWHPDMFGRKCAPNRRGRLSETASELFATIEHIIDRHMSGELGA